MPNHRTSARVRWLAERLLWWPLLAAVGYAWYLFGARLMHAFGPGGLADQLGPAAGLMLAAAVVVTLWRWSTRDSRRFTLEAGTCPRCYALITRYEYPPLPGVRDEPLRGWHCDNCGLEDAQTLTPNSSAS